MACRATTPVKISLSQPGPSEGGARATFGERAGEWRERAQLLAKAQVRTGASTTYPTRATDRIVKRLCVEKQPAAVRSGRVTDDEEETAVLRYRGGCEHALETVNV